MRKLQTNIYYKRIATHSCPDHDKDFYLAITPKLLRWSSHKKTYTFKQDCVSFPPCQNKCDVLVFTVKRKASETSNDLVTLLTMRFNLSNILRSTDEDFLRSLLLLVDKKSFTLAFDASFNFDYGYSDLLHSYDGEEKYDESFVFLNNLLQGCPPGSKETRAQILAQHNPAVFEKWHHKGIINETTFDLAKDLLGITNPAYTGTLNHT